MRITFYLYDEYPLVRIPFLVSMLNEIEDLLSFDL